MTIQEEFDLSRRSDAELLEVLATEVRLNGSRSIVTGEYIAAMGVPCRSCKCHPCRCFWK